MNRSVCQESILQTSSPDNEVLKTTVFAENVNKSHHKWKQCKCILWFHSMVLIKLRTDTAPLVSVWCSFLLCTNIQAHLLCADNTGTSVRTLRPF